LYSQRSNRKTSNRSLSTALPIRAKEEARSKNDIAGVSPNYEARAGATKEVR